MELRRPEILLKDFGGLYSVVRASLVRMLMMTWSFLLYVVLMILSSVG